MIYLTYNFCINDFEGPLDLLLHLVKSSEMDIYEIKTTIIIEEYLNLRYNFKIYKGNMLHIKKQM